MYYYRHYYKVFFFSVNGVAIMYIKFTPDIISGYKTFNYYSIE
jgi:hypothetical protein